LRPVLAIVSPVGWYSNAVIVSMLHWIALERMD
jgi:hypothetical protein